MAPSTDSCYALVTYPNGTYEILLNSKIRRRENGIRYNGSFYHASILKITSKEQCEQYLKIIENQPSVIILQCMPGSKQKDVERPTTSMSDAVFIDIDAKDTVVCEFENEDLDKALAGYVTSDTESNVSECLVSTGTTESFNKAVADYNATCDTESFVSGSLETPDLDEILTPCEMHENMEIDVSNKNTPRYPCLNSPSGSPQSAYECLETPDFDEDVTLTENHITPYELDELDISMIVEETENVTLTETDLSACPTRPSLHPLYTDASQEVEAPFSESYVNTTLQNMPTPADIRKDAVQHTSFTECQCLSSRTAAKPKPILDPEDKSKYWRLKYHFCIYCKQRVTRFARHLTNVHKDEPEVGRINSLPVKHPVRMKILDNIRHRGMLMYNLDDRYNMGDLIVVRRPAKETPQNAYIPCSSCGGNFRKRNIARHYKKCSNKEDPKKVTFKSRLLGKPILRGTYDAVSTLMSRGKEDILAHICVQDTAILIYGATLIENFQTEPHRDNDIRSKLRHMAALLLELKKLDTSIKELMDAFHPQHYTLLKEAINALCGYDENARQYKKPAMATNISTMLKKCLSASITHMIVTTNNERRINMKSLLHLIETGFTGIARSGVNKLQQKKMSRAKKVPLAADIHKLNMYLKNQAASAYKTLQEGFDEEAWNALSDATLLLVMIFNRKRTGETERILVSNYESKTYINENSDLYKTFSEEEQQISKLFSRMAILGKWRRVLVLLFPPLFVTYLDTVLKYRVEAGVPKENHYLFGTKAGVHSHRFANAILRNASNKCGAENPTTLRGTDLRKHMATVTQMVDLTDSDVKLLSHFMGHEQSIHENVYRSTDTSLQMTKISKLLMAFNKESVASLKGKTLDEIEMDSELLEGTSTSNSASTCASVADEEPIETDLSSPSCTDYETDEYASDNSVENISKKKPPKKKPTFQRRRWSPKETQQLDFYFKSYYTEKGGFPSVQQVEAVRAKCFDLKDRTTKQIIAQICNKKKVYKK